MPMPVTYVSGARMAVGVLRRGAAARVRPCASVALPTSTAPAWADGTGVGPVPRPRAGRDRVLSDGQLPADAVAAPMTTSGPPAGMPPPAAFQVATETA
ncbi:hypothetical protein TPA0910_38430 [Streptomyces hygroscopicus subsp. sporocinereus]|uniref:Uncharacterized protein n=1 Tax=Streptomyces hygroscopicus TaxID=1912 RepID=A0ABQ3U1D9_STRHY|nr:hypothetical protein TPA0910_38430 [Streptomyces hygroscopicus]